MLKFIWPVLVFVFAVFVRSQQQFTVDDAPGPLSPAHRVSPGLKNCGQCHNDDLEVVPQKCLACHQELASRILADRGYHRDKTEDCSVCHTEHEGDDTELVFLDVEDFDHAETGYPLLGKHRTIAECGTCHKKENSYPRETTHSYLMKDSRCLSCHEPQHPGQQDNCQACHGPNDWRVEIWGRKTE